MSKPISTKQHGAIDYLFSGTLYGLQRTLRPSDAVSRLLTVSSLGGLAMASVTRYELGLVKLLPMRAHIALDLALSPLLAAAPLLFRDERTSVKATLVAAGVVGTAAALLTKADNA